MFTEETESKISPPPASSSTSNVVADSGLIMGDEELKAPQFFDEILKAFHPDKDESKSIAFITVSHIVPTLPVFLSALEKVGEIAAIIPKGSKRDKNVLDALKGKYSICSEITKEKLKENPGLLNDLATRLTEKNEKKMILIDIGGYFSPCLTLLKENEFLRGKILGIVEDTENGHQRYEKISDISLPIVSVARSILKEAEDYYVGKSIVQATDVTLRSTAEIFLETLAEQANPVVLGFGKIGRSIAENLKKYSSSVVVYDTNEERLEQAKSKGFIKGNATSRNETNMLFCATGKRCLSYENLLELKDNVFISSCTSADDEFDLDALLKANRESVDYNVAFSRKTEIKKENTCAFTMFNGRLINFLQRGNAINFEYNAVVGRNIYLVLAELLVAAINILKGQYSSFAKIHVLSDAEMDKIARRFLSVFCPEVRIDKDPRLFFTIDSLVEQQQQAQFKAEQKKQQAQFKEMLDEQKKYFLDFYKKPEKGKIKRLFGGDLDIDKSFINLSLLLENEQKKPEAEKKDEVAGEKEKTLDKREQSLATFEALFGTKRDIALSDLFIEEQESKPERLVLINGRAGIGKSTLVQYILYQYATGKLFQQFYWVLSFRLRDLNEFGNETSFAQLLAINYELKYETFEEKKMLDAFVEYLFKSENVSKVLLILDGYDEANSDAIQRVNGLLKRDWQIILTSRPYGLEALPKKRRNIEVIGFNDKNIKAYIDDFPFEEKSSSSANTLWPKLQANVNILSVARLPVCLNICCGVHSENSALFDQENMSMTQLYQAMEENLSAHNDRRLEREHAQRPKYSYAEMQPHLSKLAYIALLPENYTLIINERLAKKALNLSEPKYHDRVPSLIFYGLVKSVSGVDKTLEFLHFTFQEYFMAKYIAEIWLAGSSDKQYAVIEKFFYEFRWEARYQIVWWFVAGILRIKKDESSEIQDKKIHAIERLKELFEREPRDLLGHYSLCLQMRCCAEVGMPEHWAITIANAILEKFEQIKKQEGNWNKIEVLMRYLGLTPLFMPLLNDFFKVAVYIDNDVPLKQLLKKYELTVDVDMETAQKLLDKFGDKNCDVKNYFAYNHNRPCDDKHFDVGNDAGYNEFECDLDNVDSSACHLSCDFDFAYNRLYDIDSAYNRLCDIANQPLKGNLVKKLENALLALFLRDNENWNVRELAFKKLCHLVVQPFSAHLAKNMLGTLLKLCGDKNLIGRARDFAICSLGELASQSLNSDIVKDVLDQLLMLCKCENSNHESVSKALGSLANQPLIPHSKEVMKRLLELRDHEFSFVGRSGIVMVVKSSFVQSSAVRVLSTFTSQELGADLGRVVSRSLELFDDVRDYHVSRTAFEALINFATSEQLFQEQRKFTSQAISKEVLEPRHKSPRVHAALKMLDDYTYQRRKFSTKISARLIQILDPDLDRVVSTLLEVCNDTGKSFYVRRFAVYVLCEFMSLNQAILKELSDFDFDSFVSGILTLSDAWNSERQHQIVDDPLLPARLGDLANQLSDSKFESLVTNLLGLLNLFYNDKLSYRDRMFREGEGRKFVEDTLRCIASRASDSCLRLLAKRLPKLDDDDSEHLFMKCSVFRILFDFSSQALGDQYSDSIKNIMSKDTIYQKMFSNTKDALKKDTRLSSISSAPPLGEKLAGITESNVVADKKSIEELINEILIDLSNPSQKPPLHVRYRAMALGEYYLRETLGIHPVKVLVRKLLTLCDDEDSNVRSTAYEVLIGFSNKALGKFSSEVSDLSLVSDVVRFLLGLCSGKDYGFSIPAILGTLSIKSLDSNLVGDIESCLLKSSRDKNCWERILAFEALDKLSIRSSDPVVTCLLELFSKKKYEHGMHLFEESQSLGVYFCERLCSQYLEVEHFGIEYFFKFLFKFDRNNFYRRANTPQQIFILTYGLLNNAMNSNSAIEIVSSGADHYSLRYYVNRELKTFEINQLQKESIEHFSKSLMKEVMYYDDTKRVDLFVKFAPEQKNRFISAEGLQRQGFFSVPPVRTPAVTQLNTSCNTAGRAYCRD